MTMSNTELTAFVEERVTRAQQTLADGKVSKLDDVATGKLSVFLPLQRALQGTGTPQDLGVLDAINDTLQSLKILESKETLLNYQNKAAQVRVVKNDADFSSQWTAISPLVVLEFSNPGVNDHGEANNSTRTGAILDELAPEFAGRVVMLRVPVDTSPATAQNYNVTVTPTVIFFKSGKKIEETADFHLKSWFRAKLNELLSLKE
ncbi:hypothetical protein ALQ54_01545 [Pseudomonas syringae]|nr:hypothetical protein ALQ91_03560 [Pseudomonas syringae pv. syringae]RMN68460.1 hypothetical protein ALQ54_01545 [Pseudomonas syringae]